MKKIIVLSDTHFYKDEYKLYKPFKSIDFRDYDFIIHVGDFTSLEFYIFLNSTNKLLAVSGNNDYKIPNQLPIEKRVTIEGFDIAFLHGHTINIQNISYLYQDSDIIMFGHLHDPFYEKDERYLNTNRIIESRLSKQSK